MDLRFLLLLVCFFVSGFAALLYQTAWTREFAFLFGTSELAVVAVLAAYMGGLALGAAAAARYVGRLTRPVLVYGLMELGIAICALLVPLGIRIVQGIYLAIAGGLDAPPETMALSTAIFHLFGSFLVLVPCTALMGATLPLLARYAISEDQQVGPRIGVLYAVNTFGAIAGTLVAAFFFLPEFGLRNTVYIGIAGNAIVFLAAALLASTLTGMEPEAESVDLAARRRFHWILPAMTISGAVSFLYEVLWTRLLGQILGGSTAAFASMLSSFLLGIALGSALASRFAKTRESAAVGFALSQLGIGGLAWCAFRMADMLPMLANAVGASPASPAPGAAAAGIILLPVTLCIGATFPFGVRLLTHEAEEAGALSGRVYAWNTVGSIIGAILAGFLFLPMLGLENTALLGVLTSLALAFVAAWLSVPRRRVIAAFAGVAAAAGLLIGLPMPLDLLMHSAITGERMDGELFYVGVGRSATVTVIERPKGWRLLTNGLPESGVERAGVPTMRFNETAWLSLLPTAVRPDADKMMIIGLGAGQTLAATSQAISDIDMIELEEEVVVANRLIPRTSDPLADPRVHLRLGDARGAMTLSDARYDAIVSQPSHPWTSGASHLYTREFFELVDSKLEPGGVFIQWIGAGFVDTELFGSLMAAMTEVFPHVQVYRPVPVALVFVASNEPIDLAESAPRALAENPADFGQYGIHTLEDFYASWALDDEGVRSFSAGKQPNTDDHNRLATKRMPPAHAKSSKRRFQDLEEAFARYEPLTPERLAAVDGPSVIRRMLWLGDNDRAARLLESLPPEKRNAAWGWVNYYAGRLGLARKRFDQALAENPNDLVAIDGRIALHATAELDRSQLDPVRIAAIEASEALSRRDWARLKELDAELAEIQPGDALHASAVRARLAWRTEIGSTADAQLALELIDQVLTRERSSDHYYLRALVAAKAGEPEAAWIALDVIAGRKNLKPQLRTHALALARSLGEPPPGSTVIKRLIGKRPVRRR